MRGRGSGDRRAGKRSRRAGGRRSRDQIFLSIIKAAEMKKTKDAKRLSSDPGSKGTLKPHTAVLAELVKHPVPRVSALLQMMAPPSEGTTHLGAHNGTDEQIATFGTNSYDAGGTNAIDTLLLESPILGTSGTLNTKSTHLSMSFWSAIFEQ
ncbi:hypothetical protein KIL84_020960 [Mauremys mutica]|uniref:Uncharacterized protein n=1 Tax=Mauremys mutica TaxID=74926 RepID=A0A9D3XAM5_9SAUR|nr:hypothetical protein KIL84_020960 [Mauremys mutica]